MRVGLVGLVAVAQKIVVQQEARAIPHQHHQLKALAAAQLLLAVPKAVLVAVAHLLQGQAALVLVLQNLVALAALALLQQ